MFYGYGLPKVGNQNFANIDSVTRITSLKDTIPIVSGRSLGFHHPFFEAHIDNSQI